MDSVRALPSNVQAEQSVLGYIINNQSKISDVEESLSENDFYVSSHKKIFKAIRHLNTKDISVDLITLLEEINRQGIVQECGGVSYVTELTSGFISGSNIKEYIQIVKDKADRRHLIRTGRDLIEKSYNEEEIQSALTYAEDEIYKIASSKDTSDIVPIAKAVDDALTRIERNYTNGGTILGETTGYKELDNATNGLQKGDFMLVAARPSMGKTAFALNLGQYASKKSNVAIFSLEMTKEQLTDRLLAAKCLVPLNAIRTGSLSDEQFGKTATYSNDLAKRNIFIDDEATNISDIKAKCRKLKVQQGLDVVIIDYLQLIEGGNSKNSREQEISSISRELKKLAKKLEITIIALSQLSRAPEQRADHRPMLSDLRESGSLEQDADIIIMLYRDEYYNKESDEKNIAEVIINKNRNGEVKTVKLAWVGQYQRFASLDLRG